MMTTEQTLALASQPAGNHKLSIHAKNATCEPDDVSNFKYHRYSIYTRNPGHCGEVALGNQENNFNNPVTSPPFFLLATSP